MAQLCTGGAAAASGNRPTNGTRPICAVAELAHSADTRLTAGRGTRSRRERSLVHIRRGCTNVRRSRAEQMEAESLEGAGPAGGLRE